MRPILFDFNGTLYNDTPFHIAAWKQFLKERLNLSFTDDEIRDICIGPSNASILRRLSGPDTSDETIHELARQKETCYRAVCSSKEENLRLIDGAPEMFDMLKARNIPYVLATTSEIDNINFYLHTLMLDRWFTMDNIVYDDGIVPNKPDPAFYTLAATRAGSVPSECIVVEDTPTGIRAAINAGVKIIIAMDRTMTEETFAQFPQITEQIHDYTDFASIIERYNR